MTNTPTYSQNDAERVIAAYLNLPDGITFDLTEYSENDVRFKITVELDNREISPFGVSVKLHRDLDSALGANRINVWGDGEVHINRTPSAEGDSADKHILSIIEEAAEAQRTLFKPSHP